MIGLDTNILVRYIASDDPQQSRRAVEIVEELLTAQNPGFVGAVVVTELVWVLQRSYGCDRATIGRVLEHLLRAESLTLEHAREVAAAMILVRDANADFADALIAEIASSAGCAHTLTFDRRAQRLAGFAAA